MRERVRKLLRPWNSGKEDIIDRCIEWVESIVDSKNRRFVSILSLRYIINVCYVVCVVYRTGA